MGRGRLVSNLFKPRVNRHTKTGVWIPCPKSMARHVDCIEKCILMNELDVQMAKDKGVTVESYRKYRLNREMGG